MTTLNLSCVRTCTHTTHARMHIYTRSMLFSVVSGKASLKKNGQEDTSECACGCSRSRHVYMKPYMHHELPLGTMTASECDSTCFTDSATITMCTSTDDEKDGFHMRVENGSKPENGTVCKNGMMSEVILTCDKNAPWDNQDISEYLLLAYHHGDDPCMVSNLRVLGIATRCDF